jgi:hypothetical protein
MVTRRAARWTETMGGPGPGTYSDIIDFLMSVDPVAKDRETLTCQAKNLGRLTRS